MRYSPIALAVLMVISVVGAAAAPVTAQQADGYAGTHVQFDAADSAVLDYSVNGNVVLENITMQSASDARNQAGIGADAGLGTATNIAGAQIESQTEARASVEIGFASGGSMQSHDNQRGVVQFHAEGEDQFVQVQVSPDGEAEQASDTRVVVRSGDGAEGAFIVVGEGEVAVNDEGHVNAEIAQGSELIYRQYDGDRSDDDEEAERMIEEGTATAELYVQQSADEGEETAVHAIEYGQDTTVEVVSESRDHIEVTVERTESEGRVLLTSVADEAFDRAGDIEVYVDGEAAARADSYSAVEQSASEGDEPRYYVQQSSSTEATTDVVVGIDHFSERTVEMQSDEGDGDTDGDGAGFGAIAALAALGAALFAIRASA